MKCKYYYKDGSILDYRDYNKTLHREDGPAFRYYDFDKVSYEEYYLEGKHHRVGGPATINYYENGEVSYRSYWLEDNIYNKEDYYKTIEEVKNMDEATRLTDPRKWVRELGSV